MSDPAEAFAVAQEAALRGSAALAAVMGLGQVRLYAGVVPAKAPLPFVVLGDDLVVGTGPENGCAAGSDITVRVHVWVKPEVSKEGPRLARAIAGVIRGVLDVPLAIEGHIIVVHEFESATYLTDPDGSTHAVLTFAYQTEPALVSEA